MYEASQAPFLMHQTLQEVLQAGKSTAAENKTIPRSIISVEDLPLMKRPISISGHASIEPKFATGTSALRRDKGA